MYCDNLFEDRPFTDNLNYHEGGRSFFSSLRVLLFIIFFIFFIRISIMRSKHSKNTYFVRIAISFELGNYSSFRSCVNLVSALRVFLVLNSFGQKQMSASPTVSTSAEKTRVYTAVSRRLNGKTVAKTYTKSDLNFRSPFRGPK